MLAGIRSCKSAQITRKQSPCRPRNSKSWAVCTSGPAACIQLSADVETKAESIRIRAWKYDDLSSIAAVWADALYSEGYSYVSSWQNFLSGDEDKENQQIKVQSRLQITLEQSNEARQLIRNHASKLSVIGDASTANTTSSAAGQGQLDRKQAFRLRRRRMTLCLVAEDAARQQVIGYLLLRPCQPQALLPPPFPSWTPYRLYIEALAVLPSHRRQGIATSLLDKASRLARMWRQPALWLHVDAKNQPGLDLYLATGFHIVSTTGGWLGARRRFLMKKPIAVRPRPSGGSLNAPIQSAAATAAPGNVRKGDGVFVWTPDQLE